LEAVEERRHLVLDSEVRLLETDSLSVVELAELISKITEARGPEELAEQAAQFFKLSLKDT
jgi:hypothetical protein